MNDIDKVLAVVENPTRRRILMALVREPHYPLQLSKELGVSQQAIMKNLDILERNGFVMSRKENSDRGPLRTVYRPVSEFTLTIDLRNGMFRAALSEPEEAVPFSEDGGTELEEIRGSLAGIDREIGELDRTREKLIEKRNMIIGSFMNGPAAGGLDYRERSILYEMLNSPDHDIGRVSEEMGFREDRIAEIMDGIRRKHMILKGGMKYEQ